MRVQVPTLRCPLCGAVLPNTYRTGRPLGCPGCSAQLKPSRAYLNLALWTALGPAVGICYLLGFRGIWLLIAALALWLPVDFVWMFVYVQLVPPRFEPYRTQSPGRRGHSSGLFPR
jgi:hypothetical protein